MAEGAGLNPESCPFESDSGHDDARNGAARLESEFAVGAKPNELQNIRPGLAVDEHQIGPDVTIAVVLPVAREGMVSATDRQRSIVSQVVHCSGEDAIEEVAMQPLGLALVVFLEPAEALNRPHSGQPLAPRPS